MSRSVLWKNGITVFKVKVTAKVQNVSECLSRWYRLNHRTYFTKFGLMMQRYEPECPADLLLLLLLLLLSSTSRSQRGLIRSMHDSFYYIIWTVDSLATKLGLITYDHKPECSVKRIGLLHSRSRSQRRIRMLMFVQMISSKPPNILFPNLVL